MILLVGATGFTGGFILDLLLDNGYKVRCLTRKTSDTSKIKNKNVEIVFGDLDDFSSLLKALEGVDTVVYAASLGFGHAAGFVKACEEAGIKRTVFFSTTSIFTKLNPSSKKIRLEAEDCIKSSSLDYTILRPTMIYGTHADRNMCRLVSLISKISLIPVIGNGEYLQQPVYVQDLAKAVILALQNPISIQKEYNVPGGKELTYNQVIDTIARLLNKKVIKIHVPLWLCTSVLGLYEKLVRKPRLKKEQALRLNENKNFSIDKIQGDLGYTAKTFEEGIKLEIEEMRANGFLAK